MYYVNYVPRCLLGFFTIFFYLFFILILICEFLHVPKLRYKHKFVMWYFKLPMEADKLYERITENENNNNHSEKR